MGVTLSYEDLKEAVAELDYQNILNIVKWLLEAKGPPRDIIEKGLSPGLMIVGERYEKGEYFLSELIFVAEIMKDSMELLEEKFGVNNEDNWVGTAVIGTVSGDLHDIGKNVLIMLMRASGFKVIDLGIDVPVDEFVNAVKKHKPDILGMSALLSTTAPTFKRVVDSLMENKIRKDLFILVGGPTHISDCESGADGYYNDAFNGVKAALEFVENKRKR